MNVYRISTYVHAKTFNASGKSNRWNKDNQFVMYAGQSRSLATLESVVHYKLIPAIKFEMMVISLPEDMSFFTEVRLKDLPKNWKTLDAYPMLQEIGSNWYENNTSLILRVPSVIIPQEHNYVINTKHPDFIPSNVTLLANEDYFWDQRLFVR